MSAFREAPAPSADAVRSIRIAHTLIERYLVLARMQPQSSGEMELQIGEARQIYPEIWRHLDVARKALVASGRDVTRFDEYRRSELVELGVTDVDFSRELDFAALMLGRIRERTVKTATFNVGGAQRAASAMGALMATMPEVDFAALARAEERDPGSRLAPRGQVARHREVAGRRRCRRRRRGADPPARDGAVRHAGSRGTSSRRGTAATAGSGPGPDRHAAPAVRGVLQSADEAEPARGATRRAPDRHRRRSSRRSGARRRIRRAPIVTSSSSAFGVDDVVCEGILAPALALFVLAGGKRALLAPEDTFTIILTAPVDLIPPAPAPLPMFVGIGDFDGDGTDEVVTADATHLIVTEVRDGAFVDIPGPTLKAGCSAVPRVEGDFRNGNTGKRAMLVLAVDNPHPKQGCPTTGRHTYSFAGGALVED